MDSDKELECQRYDDRAVSLLSDNDEIPALSGSHAVPLLLRAPYVCYESLIDENISGGGSRVLEIGAGTGAFTETLLKTGAQVFATDISVNSLNVIEKKSEGYNNLQTRVADMESLPFDDGYFDAVTSAGSLSYGDNLIVLGEIYRVLKEGGVFICVDSLNHNPVYRLNRWFHYLRGNRTLSTLNRMPVQRLIDRYEDRFGAAKALYFGSISWMAPLFRVLFSEKNVANIVNRFDKMLAVKKSAFKFVMVVKKVK